MGCGTSKEEEDPLGHLALSYDRGGEWNLAAELHNPRQARALANLLPAAGITRLCLDWNTFAFMRSCGSLACFTEMPPYLEKLSMVACELKGGAEEPGLVALGRALASLKTFSELDLSLNPLSGLPPVLVGAVRHRLSLQDCKLLGGVGEWAPHLAPSLVDLVLSGVPLRDRGAAALAPHLPGTLEVADFSRVGMGDAGMAALAPHLPGNLIHLDLTNGTESVKRSEGFNFMTPASVEVILEHLPRKWKTPPRDVLRQQLGMEGLYKIERALRPPPSENLRKTIALLHAKRTADGPPSGAQAEAAGGKAAAPLPPPPSAPPAPVPHPDPDPYYDGPCSPDGTVAPGAPGAPGAPPAPAEAATPPSSTIPKPPLPQVSLKWNEPFGNDGAPTKRIKCPTEHPGMTVQQSVERAGRSLGLWGKWEGEVEEMWEVAARLQLFGKAAEVAGEIGDPDMCSAITCYTYHLDGVGREDQIRSRLSAALGSRNPEEVEVWSPFLYFLLNGMKRMPNHEATLYRGVSGGVQNQEHYKVGTPIMWTTLTSTSPCREEAEQFLSRGVAGEGGDGVLFEIKATRSVEVSVLSAFPTGGEMLLPANCHLTVFNLAEEEMELAGGGKAKVAVITLVQTDAEGKRAWG